MIRFLFILLPSLSYSILAGAQDMSQKDSPETAAHISENYNTAPINTIFPQGAINPYSQYFTGKTYLTMLSLNDTEFNAPIGNVTFEPGARTNWHKHSGGQILLVLAGEGRFQERGKSIQNLKKGDVVRIAPNVEHWHGAAPESWFTHISVETNVPNNQVTWLKPVDDTEYK